MYVILTAALEERKPIKENYVKEFGEEQVV